MRPLVICKVFGLLLTLFSFTLAPPLLVSFWYGDQSHASFIIAFVITLGTGLLVWYPARADKQDLRMRDGFLVTALFWTVLGLFGCLPFAFSTAVEMSVVDAAFESISGLTTTGATVMVGLDHLPPSLLYYRQQLQWFGGIGIVVIAVAILPMLGVGGMQLYRAETPGPMKDRKLTPRIAGTAKTLFMIYLGLTLTCTTAFWLAGMSLFDAIGHAFATVAIGGFSTHDASIGYFNSGPIMLIAIFFMIVSGINFALHFTAWQNRSLQSYWTDPECRFYMLIIIGGFVVTAVTLLLNNAYGGADSLLHGGFQLVSILTTTGFVTADFARWPTFLPFFLILLAFMGGCAGSTAGGIKMIRILLILRQGMREIYGLIHPNAVISVKIGTHSVSDRVITAVWAFFIAYALVFIVMCVLLLATGMDFTTAFTALSACLNNLGPGLGDVAAHYGDIPAAAKWLLCLAMIMGRLEVFTLLVLFTPMFWRL